MRSAETEPENPKPVTPPPAEQPTTPTSTRRRFLPTEVDFQPHMLQELEDELARSRMRESFWVSVLVHVVLVLAIVWASKFPFKEPHLVAGAGREMNATPLALPQDLREAEKKRAAKPAEQQKPVPKPPEAQPVMPPPPPPQMFGLRRNGADEKTEDAKKGGDHGKDADQLKAKASEQQGRPSQAQSEASAMQQGNGQMTSQRAQGQNPFGQSKNNPFKTPTSAGSIIAEAMRNAEREGIAPGGSGMGSAQMDRRQRLDGVSVLSDLHGIDFSPYFNRMLPPVVSNWYNLAPESVRPPMSKQGKVAIQLAIMKDGRATNIHIISSSGDVSLDRAAYGSLTESSPFPPLPSQYPGAYIELIIQFNYNIPR